MSYSSVSIIYNPKSKGPSKRNALALERLLKKDPAISAKIKVVPTEHAGHAEVLAYELAKASPKPLIISASGDGGYNEVINGAMKAQAEGATVITGLLPSGNANDHYNSIRSGVLEQLIHDDHPRRIDLLQVTVTSEGKQWQRYAHSYVGIGLTASASVRYNQNKLNPVSEWVISFQEITRIRPIKVLIKDTEQAYDSLIISNINRIGKLFFVSAKSKIDDGRFEVVAMPTSNRKELLRHIAKAMANRGGAWEQASYFSFKTVNPQKMQTDGEVHELPANATVSIQSVPQTLRCIV